MTGEVHLGLDIGGTASRFVACGPDGTILARGKSSGATGHIFNPLEKDRLRVALAGIAGTLKESDLAPSRVAAGMTGFGATVLDEVKALFLECLGVTPDHTIIVDDMILAYVSVFAPGEGHLISAGTGSIGIHIGREGHVRVGGRGILIDDAGSGSWIALRALDLMFRRLDHDGGFDALAPLARHMFAVIGGDDWHAVRQFVYGGDRGRIGTLAVAVARAAGEGDETALGILRDAGRELALLGTALVARAGRRPIGFVGGVLKLNPVIEDEIRRALAGHDLRFVETDAALTAANLFGTGYEDRLAMVMARSSLA